MRVTGYGILTGREIWGLKKEGLNQEGIFVGEGIERMGKSEGDRRSKRRGLGEGDKRSGGLKW